MNKPNDKIPLRTLIKYALFHPWHVVVAAGAGVIGTAYWKLATAIWTFFVFELLVIAITLCMKPFRRFVREQLDAIAQANATENLAASISQLRSQEQSGYIDLHRLINNFEYSTNNTLVVNECRRLLNIYHKLAASIKSRSDMPARKENDILTKMTTLAAQRNRSSIDEERLVRLQHHLALCEKNKTDFEAVVQQLNSIYELIDYTIEKASSIPVNITKLRVKIEESSTEMRVSEETLKEMEEFLNTEETECVV